MKHPFLCGFFAGWWVFPLFLRLVFWPIVRNLARWSEE
jgi:hypothetical protein